MKIKNRHFLKSKDIKKFQIKLQQDYQNVDNLFKKHTKVEKGILDDGTNIYFIDGELTFFEKENQLLPFLRILLTNLISLPKIVVDTGAVPYIVKGANVMVPGIVTVDENIKQSDYVVIVDEKHNKPLAIGVALMSANDIFEEKKGKAIRNVHYIGDKIWDSFSK
ncbi:MAG: DUF1947 domain-containing protein [Promethearchaeota archaeon]